MYRDIFKEEHNILRESLKRFVENEIVPHVDQWEEERYIPKDLFKRMGDMGYLGIRHPVEYGGSGGDIFMTIVFAEELARCRSCGLSCAVTSHTDMGSPHLAKAGSADQKEKYLRPIISGEKICAIAVTEPDAGSDVAGIKTTARKDGDSYILNGSKVFITNGYHGDILFVAAKTSPEAGHRGISMFIVERDTPGLSARKLNKMGWLVSDTAELTFEDCRIPCENLLGEENKGFYYIMRNFQDERLVISAICVSKAQQGMEDTIAYAQQRQTFGKHLSEHQVIRHKLADMAIQIEAGRQLLYHAARMYHRGLDWSKEISICKAFCGEMVNRVAYDCVQIHGGFGYVREYPVERMYRDVRVWSIGGGATEVMKNDIAKRMDI
ncbi:MAG: acyl-CoA dehydrogenase family protein [Desulfobacteraceae bacterium]|nr:acyl-CoA dehydrogenase family protein [Desulfobacteraceae bacterium]